MQGICIQLSSLDMFINMPRMEEHEMAVLVSSKVQCLVLFSILHIVPKNPYHLSFSLQVG